MLHPLFSVSLWFSSVEAHVFSPWKLNPTVLILLPFLVTQTLGLRGVKQSVCKSVYLQRIYIFLFPWTQQKSKETLSTFSIKSLQGNSWTKNLP